MWMGEVIVVCIAALALALNIVAAIAIAGRKRR